MNDKILADISKKLNVLISISFRDLVGDKEFGSRRGRRGVDGWHVILPISDSIPKTSRKFSELLSQASELY